MRHPTIGARNQRDCLSHRAFFILFVPLFLVQGWLDFHDDDSIYQFVFDIKPYLPLYKALGFDYEDDPYGQRLLADAVERLGLSPGQQNYLHKLWSGKASNEYQNVLLVSFFCLLLGLGAKVL